MCNKKGLVSCVLGIEERKIIGWEWGRILLGGLMMWSDLGGRVVVRIHDQDLGRVRGCEPRVYIAMCNKTLWGTREQMGLESKCQLGLFGAHSADGVARRRIGLS